MFSSFEGLCEYVLTQPGKNAVDMDPKFYVWVENRHCKRNEDSLCTKMITVQVKTGATTKVIRYGAFMDIIHRIKFTSTNLAFPYDIILCLQLITSQLMIT